MIDCGEWPDRRVTFEQTLEYSLSALWSSIYLFHLGGAWESETHAIPGLHPQQDPFRFPLKLRESHGVYDECGEMDLNVALDLLIRFSIRRERDLHLILEIFDRDIDQVLETVRLLRHDLQQRANQPEPEAQANVRKTRGKAKPVKKSATAKSKKVAGKKK
jgi:hypothetical protein